MHFLILAGGGGTRLWPLSRDDFAKQFHYFGDEQSLLQKSVSRFLNSSLTESISIATNHQQEFLVKDQLNKIDPNLNINIIVEPSRKNTAPAIAFAIKFLQETAGLDHSAPILVLPSDHLIEPHEVFIQHVKWIEPLIRNGRLVLFGIKPTKPETGYGYIQTGEKYSTYTHKVKRFVEKPNQNLAVNYVDSGEYLWNAGIFALTPKIFWDLLAEHSPEILSLLDGNISTARSRFDQMPQISFDYAILEKTSDLLVCPLPVSWSDIGCWDSVYDVMEKDQNRNVKLGNVFDVDTKNSLIIGGKKLISTIGLEDLLIVETEDATFISKKGESQKVKDIVQKLMKIGSKENSSPRVQSFSWGSIEQLDKGKGYLLQKIEIRAEKTWEHLSSRQCRWTLLEGEIKISVNGIETQLSSVVTEKDQQIALSSAERSSLLLLQFLE